MFATLLGPLPRAPLADDAPAEAALDAILELQIEHGLEPLTDGGWPLDREDPVGAWRSTAARTEHLVKAVIAGPSTSGAAAGGVRAVALALVDAGCGWIEVHEPAATTVGPDPDARARFADAHRALTADLGRAPTCRWPSPAGMPTLPGSTRSLRGCTRASRWT